MSIDLHAHTTASDGSFTPRELVAHAREIGLTAVGITDHDTFAGWDEAFAAGEELSVEIVPGIELSVAGEAGKFHLLGYYVNRDSELGEVLRDIVEEREKRNKIIFDRLAKLGMPLDESEVRSLAADEGVLGRPHFARAMMKRGYVTSVQEAFDKYLADGAAAHASKKVLEPELAVRLIHEAGGIAIWAHPTRPPSSRAEILAPEKGEELLKLWLDWGLDGLEIHYGAYTAEERTWAASMAEKYGLLGTGGSDFHGVSKPTVRLGVVTDGNAVPPEVLADLKGRLSRPYRH
jgi:hypothetical protein